MCLRSKSSGAQYWLEFGWCTYKIVNIGHVTIRINVEQPAFHFINFSLSYCRRCGVQLSVSIRDANVVEINKNQIAHAATTESFGCPGSNPTNQAINKGKMRIQPGIIYRLIGYGRGPLRVESNRPNNNKLAVASIQDVYHMITWQTLASPSNTCKTCMSLSYYDVMIFFWF